MSIFKKTQKEERLLNNKIGNILLFFLICTLNISCHQKKTINYCNFDKHFRSVIDFGVITKNEPELTHNKNVTKAIISYLKENYSVSSFERQELYLLNEETFFFDFIHNGKCGKVNFIGVYIPTKNKTITTHLKYYNNDLLRFEIRENTIYIYKKILVKTKSGYIIRNCSLDFYLKNSVVSFTLDDLEERSQW